MFHLHLLIDGKMFIVDELKIKANGLILVIDRPTVLNYYFSLPSLKEQKCIVDKIEELFLLCRKD